MNTTFFCVVNENTIKQYGKYFRGGYEFRINDGKPRSIFINNEKMGEVLKDLTFHNFFGIIYDMSKLDSGRAI